MKGLILGEFLTMQFKVRRPQKVNSTPGGHNIPHTQRMNHPLLTAYNTGRSPCQLKNNFHSTLNYKKVFSEVKGKNKQKQTNKPKKTKQEKWSPARELQYFAVISPIMSNFASADTTSSCISGSSANESRHQREAS